MVGRERGIVRFSSSEFTFFKWFRIKPTRPYFPSPFFDSSVYAGRFSKSVCPGDTKGEGKKSKT